MKDRIELLLYELLMISENKDDLSLNYSNKKNMKKDLKNYKIIKITWNHLPFENDFEFIFLVI